jgi:metal iron transporter
VVVAIAVGREGINTLLFASQVVLSVVLPFVAFPLIYLTSKEAVMRVQKPPQEVVDQTKKGQEQISVAFEISESQRNKSENQNQIVQNVEEETVDFSNSIMLASLAYAIWCVILVANAYAIVMLFLN